MLLSQPVSNHFWGWGGALLILSIVLFSAGIYLFFFRFKLSKIRDGEKSKLVVKMFSVEGFRDLIALMFLILFVFSFLFGLALLSNSGSLATKKVLSSEISSQASTIYGIDLSPSRVRELAEISMTVVGSDTISGLVTLPFAEESRPDQIFVFRVDSNGEAKILQSDLKFEEAPLSIPANELEEQLSSD